MKYGDIFNRYKIGKFLGSGGSSEVYSAEHLVLKQLCAVKIMSGNRDAQQIKRFIREAQLAYNIEHPNIVKTFNAGCDEATGKLFISMEYVDGQNLSQLAQKKPLDENQLLEIIKVMAGVLGYLHERQVIHRDIKPSNIMRNSEGVYKLMDFGIAKSELLQDAERTINEGNVILGTPCYTAPEQCRSSQNADIRSDIYSLGATIYHAASGHLPFAGKTPVETVVNVLNSEPEPLLKYRPDLSNAFIALIECMMSKDIQQRPADPQALLMLIEKTNFLRSPSQYITHKIFSFFYRLRTGLLKCSRLRYFAFGAILFIAILLAVFIQGLTKTDSSLGSVPEYFDGYKQIAYFNPPQKSSDIKLNSASGKYENKNKEYGIDFRLTQKNGQLKKVSAFYADCFLVPDLTPQSFTISFNYAGEGKICTYGNKQDLEFRRVDQQIQLWQKNSHVADINLNKTSQKWQNLTFSYDGMEKYLHLFSGENYLGSFRLKEKLSVESKVFSFNSKNVFLGMMIQDFQAFNGKKLPDGPIRNIASNGVSYGK